MLLAAMVLFLSVPRISRAQYSSSSDEGTPGEYHDVDDAQLLKMVSYALAPAAFAEDCARTKLIVALYDPPPDCAARVIGRNDWRRRGALTLRRSGDGFVMDATRPPYFDRPWAPAPPAPRAPLGSATAPADAMPRLEDVEADP